MNRPKKNMTKRPCYLYVGYYMNLRMFYCPENGNIYAADTYQKKSSIPLSVFAFISVVLYVIGRNMRLEEITFSITPIIAWSIILGIMIAVFFSRYTDKKNREYFENKEAFKLSKEERKELHKQARKITWLYSGSRIFLAFLAIIEPLLIVEVKDIVLLAGYCVIWFALAFCILQFRTHKRRKIKL